MKSDDSVYDPAELAALHVAGALPPEEVAAVEARLDAGDPLLAAELASYGAVLLALAEGLKPVAPDPAIRSALLEAVSGLQSGRGHRPSRTVRDAGASREIFVLRSESGAWRDTGVPGIRERVLYDDPLRKAQTRLIRMAPGTKAPEHFHEGVEECYLIEGDLQLSGTNYRGGDYMRAPSGSRHSILSTENGCLLLVWVAPGANSGV